MILSKLFNRKTKTYDDECLKAKLKESILNKRKNKIDIDDELSSLLASDYEIIKLPNDRMSLLEIDGFHLFKINDSYYSLGWYNNKNNVIEHLLITTDFINYYKIGSTSALISQLFCVSIINIYPSPNICYIQFITYLPDEIIDNIVSKLFITYKSRLSQVKVNPIRFIKYFINDVNIKYCTQLVVKRIIELNYYYIRCGKNIWLLKGR